ncbi:Protein-like protein [Smittium culicis]|uniref:Protein-like protein n=1 Tax=Smittium culicis TaxID=133412 RepID=A0A1R1XDN0_9FUNG|nr:Protein-like protein [Smittium culicis]
MDQVPAGLKSIAPYILRAKEVALVEPLISYYCLFYAVKTGLGLNFNDPDSQTYLSNLLDNLEKSKTELTEQGMLVDQAADYNYILNFALLIFAKADSQDRNGVQEKYHLSSHLLHVALNYIISTHFLDTLLIFGPQKPDIAEKIKYAKYRAAEIYKANRLNTTVAPPPQQQQQDNDIIISDSNELTSASTSHNNISDISNSVDTSLSNSFGQPPTSSNTTPTTGSNFIPQQPTNSAFSHSNTSNNNNPNNNNNNFNNYSNSNPNNNSNNFNNYSNPNNNNSNFSNNSNPNPSNNFSPNNNNSNFNNNINTSSIANTIDFESTKLAQKHAKWAISALEYEDTQTALVNLQKAIDIISKFKN